MRAIHSVSLALLFSTSLLAQGRPAFHESRGFVKDKCYSEIAQIVCKQNRPCELLVFPQMRGQVAFLLAEKPKEMVSDDRKFYRVLFKMIGSDSAQVEKSDLIGISQAIDELKKTTYLGTPIACK